MSRPAPRVRVVTLATGGDVRLRNEGAGLAALLVNGGTAKPVPGTWSATSELLARALAPRHLGVTFGEVRYRVKSWQALASCIADATAAIELLAEAGASRILLIGFSLGGAVSIGCADRQPVDGVLGLAPWIPEQLELGTLAGKRLDVAHGSWDGYLPGVPGVSPTHSRQGFERARALGVDGSYTLLSRAVHGAALRRRSGRLVRLPGWKAWVSVVDAALDRFELGG